MKILLIEDELEMSSLAVSQLNKLGHDVLTAHSLRDAYAIYTEQKEQLDLIIADHRMPDGPGVDFILDLSYTEEQVRLAVVSGCLTSTEKRLLEERKIPYFQKPILYSTVVSSFPKKTPPNAAPVQKVESNEDKASTNQSAKPARRGLTSMLFSKLTLATNLEEEAPPMTTLPPSLKNTSHSAPPPVKSPSPDTAKEDQSFSPKPLKLGPAKVPPPPPRFVLPKKK